MSERSTVGGKHCDYPAYCTEQGKCCAPEGYECPTSAPSSIGETVLRELFRDAQLYVLNTHPTIQAMADFRRGLLSRLEHALSQSLPSAIGCGCLETYPQLIHGQIAHGPGCTNPTTEYTAATEPREVLLGASLLEHTMSTFNECCSAWSDVRNASGEIDKAKYDYASALEGRVRSAINELAVLSRLLYADDKYLRPGESGLGANIRGWYESACYWRKRAEEAEAKSHG